MGIEHQLWDNFMKPWENFMKHWDLFLWNIRKHSGFEDVLTMKNAKQMVDLIILIINYGIF